MPSSVPQAEPHRAPGAALRRTSAMPRDSTFSPDPDRLSAEVRPLTRLRGILREEARGVWRAAIAFYHHDGFDRASALAFWLLLAFVPFLLVFTGLFGMLVKLFGGPDRALLDEIVTGLREVFPNLDPSVVDYLAKLIGQHQTFAA